ncbi:MAG TPA: hypothetical protein VMS93_08825 [Candidatus Saccharimonadales bacterium]|nr:hypothetical protein [Candidatus Saccharimonadales bacterium]
MAHPRADTSAAAHAPAEPVDTVARVWVDSAIVAHGGAAPWDTLRDLRFRLDLVQYGVGAERHQTSTRYLRIAQGGPRYRIETRSDSGAALVFGCTPARGWAYQNDTLLADPGAVRYARDQLALDYFLLSLPWSLRDPGVELHDVGEVVEAGRPLHFLDVDLPAGNDLWRVGIDPETHLVADARWWHYVRGGVPPRTRVELSGYTSVRGLLLPTLRRVYDGDTGRLLAEARFSDFQLNGAVPDSLFVKR